MNVGKLIAFGVTLFALYFSYTSNTPIDENRITDFNESNGTFIYHGDLPENMTI